METILNTCGWKLSILMKLGMPLPNEQACWLKFEKALDNPQHAVAKHRSNRVRVKRFIKELFPTG
jgi:hypothetical protein